MNIKAIIIIIALIVIGAGAYMVASNKTTKKPLVNQTPTVTNIATAEPKPMSFKDFLTAKGAQKCTFSESTASGKTEGVIFTTGGKVKGDITTTTSDKTTVTHMVIDQKEMYIWVDGQKQGFKTTIDEKTAAKINENKQEMNINQTYNYNCTPSSVNDSAFTLPNGIDFLDFSKMIPSIPQISISISQCATCDALSGEAKTQCKTSLKCN